MATVATTKPVEERTAWAEKSAQAWRERAEAARAGGDHNVAENCERVAQLAEDLVTLELTDAIMGDWDEIMESRPTLRIVTAAAAS
jgi:hypothetical protein